MQGVTVKGLIDSGFSVNIIDSALWERLAV